MILDHTLHNREAKAGAFFPRRHVWLDKARAAGVTVLTEPEFIALLERVEAP